LVSKEFGLCFTHRKKKTIESAVKQATAAKIIAASSWRSLSKNSLLKLDSSVINKTNERKIPLSMSLSIKGEI
jgi:hypothetical protein